MSLFKAQKEQIIALQNSQWYLRKQMWKFQPNYVIFVRKKKNAKWPLYKNKTDSDENKILKNSYESQNI